VSLSYGRFISEEIIYSKQKAAWAPEPVLRFGGGKKWKPCAFDGNRSMVSL